VNPLQLQDAAAGLLLPLEVDPAVALDEPLMQLVGPAGWRVGAAFTTSDLVCRVVFAMPAVALDQPLMR
jgi:hypothetical protein